MPAQVTSRVQASDGTVWTLYNAQPRPTAGDYVLALDGTVSGPGPGERRALADGQYQVLLSADAAGRAPGAAGHVRRCRRRHHASRDPEPDPAARPHLAQLRRARRRHAGDLPTDQDGHGQRLRRSRRRRRHAARRRGAASGSRPRSASRACNGTASSTASRCPPAPTSSASAPRTRRATSAKRASTVTIEDPGVPDATIVSARITPNQIVRGGQVCADVTVRNTGADRAAHPGSRFGLRLQLLRLLLVDPRSPVRRPRRLLAGRSGLVGHTRPGRRHLSVPLGIRPRSPARRAGAGARLRRDPRPAEQDGVLRQPGPGKGRHPRPGCRAHARS